jgi:tRNA1(Val) A37 N6-methylase TrmN6
MMSWIDQLLPIGGILVDFCSGGGHLGLAIAAARLDAQVHLVEKKKQHVDIARKRIEMVGLVSRLKELRKEFSLALADFYP